MAVQSKHYFNIGFKKDVTFCFRQTDNGYQSTKIEYVFHLLVGEWKKDFVIWKVIK